MMPFRFPLDITITAPVTEIRTPANLRSVSLSLKISQDRRVMNIGLLAMIMEARPASINLSPLKKKTLYANTPVSPRRITGKICFLRIAGKLPSIFQVIRIRKNDAVKNRRKEAENGPTFWARTLPAINVPPQKAAVKNSFIYIIILFSRCITNAGLI